MKKKNSRDSFCKKYIYKFATKPTESVGVFKQESILSEPTYYKIVKSKDIYLYLSKNKKDNLVLIKYYEIKDFDLSLLHSYKVTKNIYAFDDITVLYNIIEINYSIEGKYPILNIEKNKCIQCQICNFLPKNSNELVNHLYSCKIYKHTLFGQNIPKYLNDKKSITNNVTINNTYNYHVSFRSTFDYIRNQLSVEDQMAILNSIDKVGEMVKRHFMFPEIAGNIRIKNSSPYSTCEIFNGERFELKNNKDIFKLYILDNLDSLDFMSYALGNERITRNLEKYDNNIRKNDNNMNACIKKTIKEVKFLSENK